MPVSYTRKLPRSCSTRAPLAVAAAAPSVRRLGRGRPRQSVRCAQLAPAALSTTRLCVFGFAAAVQSTKDSMKWSIRKNTCSEMEQMVRECTLDDAQPLSEMLMREIAEGTFTAEFPAIMRIIWKHIKDQTNEHRLSKCLLLLEFLLQHGNHDLVLLQVVGNLHHIQTITSFSLHDDQGIDVGYEVRAAPNSGPSKSTDHGAGPRVCSRRPAPISLRYARRHAGSSRRCEASRRAAAVRVASSRLSSSSASSSSSSSHSYLLSPSSFCCRAMQFVLSSARSPPDLRPSPRRRRQALDRDQRAGRGAAAGRQARCAEQPPCRRRFPIFAATASAPSKPLEAVAPPRANPSRLAPLASRKPNPP